MITRRIIYILLSMLSVSAFSQSKADTLIQYTPDFNFKEGVYANFGSVLYNNPLPKNRIFSEYSYSDNDFYEKVLSNKNIFYFDNLGNRLELQTKNIWGYARNGFLYIQVSGDFFKITMMGNISHFVAIQTYETYPSNHYYNSYNSQYPYSNIPRQETEIQQYLLDFSNGEIYPYTAENLEILLMKDPELLDEYVMLSKRKRKQLKFIYLRKFNERNPLFLIKK